MFVVFPYFNAVDSNLVPGQFASIFQIKQISIITKAIQKREVTDFEIAFLLPSPSPLSLLKLLTVSTPAMHVSKL